MFLQNCQQRAFILPANPDNTEHAAVTINPGASVEVHNEHWAAVRKGNDVIEALVSGRYLVPTTEEARILPHLSNPPTGERPAELQDTPDDVKVDRKSETIVVGGDDSAAPRRGRRG